mmetsp:Transcript_3670/g.9369  ORF Transcript_3670/g.9369 Transcript_3670/m.9369 type:complete len:694 (-) Transcript_3670:174-2255(-)
MGLAVVARSATALLAPVLPLLVVCEPPSICDGVSAGKPCAGDAAEVPLASIEKEVNVMQTSLFQSRVRHVQTREVSREVTPLSHGGTDLGRRRTALLQELQAIEAELSQASCDDRNQACSEWAKQGECRRNANWMNANCMRSCGQCPAPTPASISSCVDSDSRCGHWAQQHQCTANPEWMGEHCRKSCGKCPSCTDKDNRCAAWAAHEQCSLNRAWMHANCPKSCSVCGSGPGPAHTSAPTRSPTRLPTPEQNCKDSSSSCAAWAKAGQCSANPKWMNANCKKSCRVCGGTSTGEAKVTWDAAHFPVLHGFAYGPSPMLHTGQLPNDDFMMDAAAPLWGPDGRSDLAVMAAIGGNVVRLYGNDPQWNHRNFLDEAHKNNLGVIVGMSDWPYTQMNDPPNCLSTQYLCYDQLYASYKANLESGGFLTPDGKSYHPALTAVIVINEPELKIGNTGADTIDSEENLAKRCKLLASAWDAMLQVETDLGVTGNLVHYTITWSFAQFNHPPKKPGLGQMEYFWECVQNPGQYGYSPKNDLMSAFLSRWINGFNTQNWAASLRTLMFEPYQKSVFAAMGMPVFIGEYHSLNTEASDLAADLKEVRGMSEHYPFFKGFAFFEFTKRYDKGSEGRQDEFGMFGFGKRELSTFIYFSQNYSVRCLDPIKAQNGVPMMDAFKENFEVAGGVGSDAVLTKALCA